MFKKLIFLTLLLFTAIFSFAADITVTKTGTTAVKGSNGFNGYVEITNSTGYDIYYIYVSHTSASGWEDDVLGNNVLYNGQTVRVNLNGFPSAIFDIKCQDVDEDTYFFMSFNVSTDDLNVTLADLDSSGGNSNSSQTSSSSVSSSYSSQPVVTNTRALEEMFGTTLINASGQSIPVSSLQGKKIGIYFSASWCPPCRAFTPTLVRTYEDMIREGKLFAIVLVPSDRSEADAMSYMRNYNMPWLALRFN